MVKGLKMNAIVAEKDGETEIRCGYCGKLLFIVELKQGKNTKKTTSSAGKYGKINIKCTRCTAKNEIVL
jgi:phage FluMu protein Com